MITQNDLYDIEHALINIRSDIKSVFNVDIFCKIIKVLEYNGLNYEDNQIRRALASISGLDQEKWGYINFNYFYIYRNFLKDKKIYALLVKLCKESICILECTNFARAYDLIDSYHCLPSILVYNNFSIPKSFWKNYIKPYRNKWDKTFLIAEQKALTKRNWIL